MDKEKIRAKIKELIKNYKELEKSKGIKGMREISEADVRADFVDELFLALGWNVKNPDEYDREHYVRKVGYADIALKLAKEPAVFVEAKRFGEIEDVIKREGGDWMDDERQVMNYAIGNKIKWAVLTNFEKFRVFNAFNGFTILDIKAYWEYEERLEELVYLSKEYVESEQINKLERREEREDIDLGFLQSLNNWRLRLANDIYRNNKDNSMLLDTNKNLDLEKLKSSVQRILDRLIIIRYAEDRLILDNPDQLKSLYEAWQSTKTYTSLVNAVMGYFKGFDKIYDGKIFEKGHICEKVKIGDNLLGEIISNLYKINFRKFDFDILGNTYETYLGNTLHLKEDGTLGLKPSQETRKEAGIYYTPPFVVDYIVKNTLGELLKNKTAEEVKKIRVLDPACGSGSFLIKAFDYFKDYYEKENEKIRKQREEKIREYMKSGKNQLRLDLDALKIEELKGFEQQILENNIFGVDLDRQAAEIAAVNLMLKALKPQEKLPLILEENIKVGNSLISGTEEELEKYFGVNWKEKRPFNWKNEFPQIFDNGGFDVVIGNPPYGVLSIRERRGAEIEKDVKYFRKEYKYQSGKLNTYKLFCEKAISLLREGGKFGFIIPSTILCDEAAKNLRRFFIEKTHIEQILEFPEKAKVFKGVTQDVTILICSKKKVDDSALIRIALNLEGAKDIIVPLFQRVTIRDIRQIGGEFLSIPLADKKSYSILKKIHKHPPLKGDEKYKAICEIYQGEVNLTVFKDCLSLNPTGTSLLRGNNIRRYSLLPDVGYKEKWLNKIEFLKRIEKSKKITHPKNLRIAFQEVANMQLDYRIKATLIEPGKFLGHTTNYCIAQNETDLKYLLGLLNSKLLNWRFKLTSTNNHVSGNEVRALPIVRAPKNEKESISALAHKMLSLNKQFNEIKPDTEFKRYVEDRWRGETILFKRYVDRLSVGDKEILGDSNKRTGKIKEFEVREEGKWLVFKVGYLKKTQKGKDILVTIDVFKCKFVEDNLRKFLYHCIKEYMRPGKLGKGNKIYDKLLNIKIPRFIANEEENKRIIDEIMMPFLRELKRYMKIKKEIEETDKIIDQKVYEVYGLTDEEIKIVEESI